MKNTKPTKAVASAAKRKATTKTVITPQRKGKAKVETHAIICTKASPCIYCQARRRKVAQNSAALDTALWLASKPITTAKAKAARKATPPRTEAMARKVARPLRTKANSIGHGRNTKAQAKALLDHQDALAASWAKTQAKKAAKATDHLPLSEFNATGQSARKAIKRKGAGMGSARSETLTKFLKQAPKNESELIIQTKAEEIKDTMPLLSTQWRNGHAFGTKYVATCRYATCINDEVLDVLNEVVTKTKGKKPTQLTLYRCHPATKIKGDKIICPKGHSPKLVGLTSTASAFTNRTGSNNNNTQETNTMKTKNSKNGKAVKAVKTTKTQPKSGKAKATKTAWSLFNEPAAAVARQLGKLGWDTAEVIKAINAKLPDMSRFSIRNAAWEGKHGWDRPTASLNKTQIASLKKLVA